MAHTARLAQLATGRLPPTLRDAQPTEAQQFSLNPSISQVWILNLLEAFEKKIYFWGGALTIWSCLNGSFNVVGSKDWLFNDTVTHQIKWHHKRKHGIIDWMWSHEDHLREERNFGKGVQCIPGLWHVRVILGSRCFGMLAIEKHHLFSSNTLQHGKYQSANV